MRRADSQPLAFAGFMSRRTLEGDKSEFTCTIVTRDAVGPPAAIHIRMPIVLPKDAETAWLDPGLTDAARAIEFAREQSMSDFVLDAVNMRVNNARNEGADLITPFKNPA